MTPSTLDQYHGVGGSYVVKNGQRVQVRAPTRSAPARSPAVAAPTTIAQAEAQIAQAQAEIAQLKGG